MRLNESVLAWIQNGQSGVTCVHVEVDVNGRFVAKNRCWETVPGAMRENGFEQLKIKAHVNRHSVRAASWRVFACCLNTLKEGLGRTKTDAHVPKATRKAVEVMLGHFRFAEHAFHTPQRFSNLGHRHCYRSLDSIEFEAEDFMM